jgi:hypothetical protein
MGKRSLDQASVKIFAGFRPSEVAARRAIQTLKIVMSDAMLPHMIAVEHAPASLNSN